MKHYWVIIVLSTFLFACGSNTKKNGEAFKLIKSPSSFRNTLILESNLFIDSTLKITLIDGDNDGQYLSENRRDSNDNAHDWINIKDKIRKQSSGAVLTEELTLLFYDTYYHISLDIKNERGRIEKMKTPSLEPDIALYQTLPKDSVTLGFSSQKIQLSDLLDLQNKWLLIKNWSPYCSPCVKDIAFFNQNRETLDSSKTDVLFIIDDSYREEALSYFQKTYLSDKIVFGNYEEINTTLNFRYFPSSLLYSTSGEYVKHFSFMSRSEILNHIKKLQQSM
jgi:hypothetical protein